MDKNFQDFLKGRTIDNRELKLNHLYMAGQHWETPGTLTKTQIPVIDAGTYKIDKTYVGLVYNLVEDAVETMTSFTVGEEELDYDALSTDNEKTNLWLKSLNVNKLIGDILKTGFLYKDCYLFIYQDEDTKWKVSVKSPLNITHVGEDYYIVDMVSGGESTDMFGRKAPDKLKITSYKYVGVPSTDGQEIVSKVEVKVYIDGVDQELTQLIDFMPFVKLNLGYNYITKGVLQLQDQINIKMTKNFDIDKYNADPASVIYTNEDLGKKGIVMGSGRVLRLPFEAKFERTAGMSVDQTFLEGLKEIKNDFWKKTQLFGYKNSDITGSVSGVALFWKLTETYSFANKSRSTLKLELYKVFEYLGKVLQDEESFKVTELYLSPLKGEKLKEEEYKKLTYETKKAEAEAIKSYLDAGYTRQEAEDKLKA